MVWGVQPAILNDAAATRRGIPSAVPAVGGLSGPAPAESAVAEVIRKALTAFCATHINGRGEVDHAGAKESPELAALGAAARALEAVDPGKFGKKQERLAFWINVHNSLALQAMTASGVLESLAEEPGFARRYAYTVAGKSFSLADIEHGILRGNRGSGSFRPWHFSPWDSRRQWSIRPLEPRVHFALSRGTRSGPVLKAYRPESTDDQLDTAAHDFIRAGGITVDSAAMRVRLSAIFDWYWRDFGPHRRSILVFAAPYFDDEKTRRLLRGKDGELALDYEPYNWSLNRPRP